LDIKHFKVASQFISIWRWNLVKCRLEAGLTQRDLSKILNKAQPHISKVETGERYLDVIDFVEWAQAINADPATLIKSLADVQG